MHSTVNPCNTCFGYFNAPPRVDLSFIKLDRVPSTDGHDTCSSGGVTKTPSNKSPSEGDTDILNSDNHQQVIAILELAERVQHLETIIQHLYQYLPSLSRSTEIRRSQLDNICFKLFVLFPEPSPLQLNHLVTELDRNFPGHNRRELLSLVRRWFRKRREDVGLKMMAALKKLVPQLKEQKAEVIAALEDGGFDLRALINEAKFTFTVDEAMEKFCKQKLLGHLRRS